MKIWHNNIPTQNKMGSINLTTKKISKLLTDKNIHSKRIQVLKINSIKVKKFYHVIRNLQKLMNVNK